MDKRGLEKSIEDAQISLAMKGLLKDGHSLKPDLWEELRRRLQSMYRRATGEHHITLLVVDEAALADRAQRPALSEAEIRADEREKCAKIADWFHEAACKWASTYIEKFDGQTDSACIAAAIREAKP